MCHSNSLPQRVLPVAVRQVSVRPEFPVSVETLDTGVSPYNGLAIVSAEVMPSNPRHLQSRSHTKSHPM